MGKLKSTTAWFIADANVLIDYAKISPAILGLVAQHVGPVYVAADVLQEVEQLADHVRMTMADQEAFAQALIAPAKPNAALKRAFAKANKLLAA